MRTATEYQEAFARWTKDLVGLNTGLASCCPECGDFNEEIGDEGGFSWSQCDTCGSTLGGNRYAAHGFAEGDDTPIHLDVCEDCLCYIANGDLPQGD